MSERKKLLDFLESLDEDWLAENEDAGLCGLCEEAVGKSVKLLYELMDRWPEHSGDSNFPVPHFLYTPQTAYFEASFAEMWSREYPYGAARWRLVEFCIEELRKEPS